ncbi:MAG: SMI1/KNR4 family protein [Ruminococcus sp.]|nr:SMI1/KNR4 family protein [Ruminococcus sp.]MDE7138604.1 SMI1/KNR4 family protein [Ruminococcus sp.]
MNNSISELYKMFSESIKSDNITADSIYAIYKLYSETESETTFPPQTSKQIENWESIYNVVLPKEYREFLLLSDGLVSDIFGGELFSLSDIIPCPPKEIEEFSDKSKDYFIIGNYIGDGSILLCDRNGNFYEFYHCYEPVESSLIDFLKHWYKRK